MIKTTIRSNVCAAYNEEKNNYHIEIELPGVKKKDIDLKVMSGGFMLCAPKGDIEFTGDYTFCCPVDVDKTEAKYDNGLLSIDVPMQDPYDTATKIKIK